MLFDSQVETKADRHSLGKGEQSLHAHLLPTLRQSVTLWTCPLPQNQME